MRKNPFVVFSFGVVCALVTALSAQSVRTVPLGSAGMVYSASRGLLYVAVQATSPQRPSTMTAVNPNSGTIGASLPLEAEPWTLAMSRDERYLYAGLGDGQIVRVDLQTFSRDLVVSTAATGVSDRAVLEIQPFPDRSTSFVASVGQRGFGVFQVAMAVFDGNVMRPRFLQPGSRIVRSTFGSDSSALWGYEGSDPFSFYRLRLDDEGLSVMGQPRVGLFGGFVAQMLYRDGLLFTSNGRVINPENGIIEGNYNSFAAASAHSFAVDWQRERAYFSSREGFDFHLTEFDLRTFRRVGGLISTASSVNVPWAPEQTVLCGSMLAFAGFGLDRPFITLFPLSLIHPVPAWQRPAEQPLSDEVRRLPLLHNAIAYDSTRGRILATTPNWESTIGNSVVAIDPVRGRIGDPVWIGPDPWQMAISDDAKYLYSALYSAWAVQRVRLDRVEPDLRIPLQSDEGPWGPEPTRANEILPIPGRSESFVVARAGLPGDPSDIQAKGVVVYDGDTPRPGTTALSDEDAVWSVQWNQSRQSLFAFPNFRQLGVSQQGVEVEAATEGVTGTVFSTDTMRCQNDVCFTPTGAVIDARSQESLGRLAFDVQADDFFWPDFIVPDLDRGLVYVLADLGRRYIGDRRLTVDA